MISAISELKELVKAYCARIGADPMLVQGAGGNVSWKEGETLWVKASGAWLADADRKDIFIPVDLKHLLTAIAAGDFNVSPKVVDKSELLPSIETLLHALLPHKVVIHLHAVEVLSRLVRRNSAVEINSLVDKSLRWLSVGYFKPGAELAMAINEAMKKSQDVEVVFLKNHGIVVGGADLKEVDDILKRLTLTFSTPPFTGTVDNISIVRLADLEKIGYRLISNKEINLLVRDKHLFNRLKTDWALYPDHVVFLGPKAFFFDSMDDCITSVLSADHQPELVFVRNVGVFGNEKFTEAKKVQLKCYSDVMVRQSDDKKLDSLSDEDISQLLDWDAEKYRFNLSLGDA